MTQQAREKLLRKKGSGDYPTPMFRQRPVLPDDGTWTSPAFTRAPVRKPATPRSNGNGNKSAPINTGNPKIVSVAQGSEIKKVPAPLLKPTTPTSPPAVPSLKTTPASKPEEEKEGGGVWLFDPRRVKPFPHQPRKRFYGIPALARSIRAAGQAQAGEVTLIKGDPDYDAQLVDGERRLRACLFNNQKFRATIGTGDRKTQFRRSAVANYNKKDHDCLESMGVCQQLREDGETIESTADILGKSTTWVWQHLNLQKLHPDVQMFLIPSENDGSEEGEGRGSKGKLTFALAQLLTLFPHELQKKAANEIISSGMSVFSARRYIKQLSRETGHQAGNRPQRASEKFNALQTLTKQSIDKFGVFLDMSPAEIEEMLRGRTSMERTGAAGILSRFKAELQKLIEKIK